MYGSDAKNSMEPADFRILCAGLREIWSMNANPVNKNDNARYADMKLIFQKSIVSAKELPAGSILTREMLAFKKPGDGIPAADYQSLVGRKLRQALPADHKFSAQDFE